MGSGVNRVTDSQPSPIAFLLSHQALGHTRTTPSPRTSANAKRESPSVRPNKLQRLVTSLCHIQATGDPPILSTLLLMSHPVCPSDLLSMPCDGVTSLEVTSSPRLAPGDNAPARRAKHRQQNDRLPPSRPLASPLQSLSNTEQDLMSLTDATQRSIGASGFDVPIAVDSR